MKPIGLIGGMSWQSTVLYYQHMNTIAQQRLGGLASADLLLHSVNFAEIAACQHAGDWDGAARHLVTSAQGLERAGAKALVLCTNTMHLVADQIEAACALPLIHIADATAGAIQQAGAQRPLLLATRFTMEQPFYRQRLRERHGIETLIPEEGDRATVHRVIYEELCNGVIRPESKQAYLDVIERGQQAGADSLIMGCTEITLLIGQGDFSIPVFDTTRIHAEAAMAYSLGETEEGRA